MKLAHKNFLYTTIVTGILTILVLGYFVFMLPSLYVDYVSNENYDSIVAQHKGYLKDGTYKHVNVKNPSCMTIDIPLAGDFVTITGKSFQTRITPKTDAMKNLFSEMKSYAKTTLNHMKKSNKQLDKKAFNAKVSEWKDEFKKQTDFMDNLPVDIKTKTDFSTKNFYTDESTTIHYISDDTIILEASVNDGENHYTNYMGFTYNKDRLVISYLPAMTPQMNEIRSLPMLIAVIVLFALVVSYLYSKGIVDPILRLVKHTQAVKRSGDIANASLPVKGKDEISMLVQTLNELYEEIDDNYKVLETKNMELKEKNKSQEVFLRSSSHQLKTPIAAALLLVEGMINQIGKYHDTKTYLPEVKKQLLSMRKIVEDILYLSRCEENILLEKVDLNMLISRQLSSYKITLEEGNYIIMTDYAKECFVTTDGNLLLKILDNLISNAIVHSKAGALITITTKENELEIRNNEAHIDEELIPDIFQAFVSGGKGHGLGLYIVSYYANILGMKIHITNEEDGVLTRLIFDANAKETISYM